ncbi:MAG: SusC/RagA family TonB-linked outer membrane protein [Sediminibacterium sp.]|nr:SusC/RagA family TonB-linked outer membrane protein [Sediminibacterium sp.]
MKYILTLSLGCLLLVNLFAQQVSPLRHIQVAITTSDNEPLPGVGLRLSTNKHTFITNDKGLVFLPLPLTADTLIISHVGYQTVRMAVSSSTRSFTVKLIPSLNTLEEVVVETGYQALPKERATGSFAKIDNNTLTKQVSTDILSRLEAVANSVLVDRKTLNGTNRIMIRGLSSIIGPREPLIIVDNFPYSGNINNINPNDVETVTLLKDAAAASIWGTKAGNGVIVITTKKGKFNQKISTEFNANISITGKPDLFYLKNIKSTDFIDVEQFLYSKGFYNGSINAPNKPPLSPVVELLIKKANGSISAADADAQINALRERDVRNDFNQRLYNTAVNQQYALNIRGGTNNIAWLLGAGYDHNLNELAAGYNRFTIRSENRFRLSQKLQVTVSFNYIQSNSSSGKYGYADISATNGSIPPYTRLANDQGQALSVIKTYRQPYIDTAGGGKLLDWNYYPLSDYQHVQNTSLLQDMVGHIGINYEVLKGFNAEVQYQYERQQTNGHLLQDVNSYFTRNLINLYSQLNRGTGVVTYKIPVGGILDLSNTVLVSHNIRGQLNYIKHWGQQQVTAIAGAEVRENDNQFDGYRIYGYNGDQLTTVNVDYANPYPTYITGSTGFIPTSGGLAHTVNRFVSFYTNAAYTYFNKYTLSLSGRRDASNLFGVNTNNKWTPLWSVGASWDIAKEPFFKSTTLPYLKIRATLGYSGNADPNRTGVTTISYQNASPYTQTPIARVANFYNPDLRWEKVWMTNIGVDFEVRNRVLTGSIEYYHKKATDLLGAAPLDYTSGLNQQTLIRNIAAMEGNGMDIELKSINSNRAFLWTSTLNLSLYKDKVTSYYLASTQASRFVNGVYTIAGVTGKPVYAVFTYKGAGLDPSTGDPQGYANGQVSKDYNLLTGAASSIADLVYKGPAYPAVFGSLGNTFGWKHINLTIQLLYKLGYYFQRSSINYSSLFNNRVGHPDYANRWRQPGDEKLTTVPSMVYPTNNNRDAFYNGSELLVEKGDHIRLQFITLSYDIIKSAIKSLPVESMQIYINASNIGILWRANKMGIDPDYNQSVVPPSKNIAIGVRIKF